MKPKFFKKPADFRRWLSTNHDKKEELWVGYYKVSTNKTSITWPESVSEALCFGWIDGIRKSIDDESYMIRFTPRRPNSIWSAVNLKKIAELIEEGVMHENGLAVYEQRKEDKSNLYSFEQKKKKVKLPKEYELLFKKNKVAWTNFKEMAPYYQRASSWWVISAKREETRLKRLTQLIDDSEHKLKVKPLRS